MEMLVLWIILCALVAAWAQNWGRNAAVYFLGSLLCSPLLAAVSLLIEGKDEKKIETDKITGGDSRKCPFCAELIKAEAIKCRHCGSTLPKCPYCAELIKAEAVKCHHCGSDLPPRV